MLSSTSNLHDQHLRSKCSNLNLFQYGSDCIMPQKQSDCDRQLVYSPVSGQAVHGATLVFALRRRAADAAILDEWSATLP